MPTAEPQSRFEQPGLTPSQPLHFNQERNAHSTTKLIPNNLAPIALCGDELRVGMSAWRWQFTGGFIRLFIAWDLCRRSQLQVAAYKGDTKQGVKESILPLTYVGKPIIINSFHRGPRGWISTADRLPCHG